MMMKWLKRVTAVASVLLCASLYVSFCILLCNFIAFFVIGLDERTYLVLNDFTDEQMEIIYHEFSLSLPDEMKPESISYDRKQVYYLPLGIRSTTIRLSFPNDDPAPFFSSYDEVDEKAKYHRNRDAYPNPYYSAVGKDGKEIRIKCGDTIVLEKFNISTKAFKEMPKDREHGWREHNEEGIFGWNHGGIFRP